MSHSKEQQLMDAVVLTASGPPAESLTYRSEPMPQPGPGKVLVEVHAAAVNPLDIANMLGFLGTPLPMMLRPGSRDGARPGTTRDARAVRRNSRNVAVT